MKFLPFLMFVITGFSGFAQLPYTENLYGYTVETNVEYGQAIDFAGINDTLLMDIYKPVGDGNCLRPCMVIVHGGSWIAGSKEDIDIVNISKDFAQKGWVVASINYRLGTHKAASYDMYWACNADISAPCAYISDSSEIFRANYRGQQDTKGAIRFMKNRGILDSIDVHNLFLAGQSAGGFVALAAAFTDKNSEKPEFCETIANAPTPDSDLIGCLPAGYSLARPDLGDINGDLNLGGHDATVQGVGNIFGGMLNFEMIEGDTEWPVLYQFHQGSDVVVHYNYARLLGRTNHCYSLAGNICQPYYFYPFAYGSKGIETYLAGLGSSPERVSDIIENYEYEGDCFDNGHAIDNWVLRAQNMANLFAERISDNGNTPDAGPCHLALPENDKIDVQVFPNPSNGMVNVQCGKVEKVKMSVFGSDGKLLFEEFVFGSAIINLQGGIYTLVFSDLEGEQTGFSKLIVL